MSRRPALCGYEHGFTLAEVLITIVIMGIVFAIASSTWFRVVEGGRVDSASNQLVADMRLAHTRATNRLEDWQVILTADSSTYTVGPAGSLSTRDLDDDPGGHEVIVDAAATITFESEGSAVLPGGASSTTFTVSSADGDPVHVIEINAATSRTQIDP